MHATPDGQPASTHASNAAIMRMRADRADAVTARPQHTIAQTRGENADERERLVL